MNITEPCVDKKFFLNRKFKEIAPNTYERENKQRFLNPTNGLQEEITQKLQFKIFNVDPEFGTWIEVRINGELDNNPRGYGAGYWLDQKDFESTFKGL